MKDHIRDERATREKYKLVGNGLELEDRNDTRTLCVAFCGKDASGAWFFKSVDQLIARRSTTTPPAAWAGPQPSVCDGCVDVIVKVLKP